MVIALFACGVFAYHYFFPTPYVSTQDNFKIVFPGTPTVNKITPKSSNGVTESGRLYSYQKQSSNTDYAVYVIKYSVSQFSSYSALEKKALLQSDVDQIAEAEDSALNNGKFITFKDLTAVSATVIPTSKSDESAHEVAFLNNDRFYMIIGAGLTQSKFNSFANTFNFTN